MIHTGKSSCCLMGFHYSGWAYCIKKIVYKLDGIVNCLRVFALLDLIVAHGISELVIRLSDKNLAKQLQKILQSAGLGAIRSSVPCKGKLSLTRTIYNNSPFFLRGLFYLLRCGVKARKYKTLHRRPVIESDLSIVSYFPNIDLECAKQGKFYSNYWGKGHDLLD